MMRRWLAYLVLPLTTFAAPATSGAAPDWVSWDDATWTLTSKKPLPGTFTAWQAQTNGYIGLAQGSLGPFFELSRFNDSEGWPSYSAPRRTFATVTGFWGSEPSTDELEPRGESFISGLPHFTDLLVRACGDLLDGSTDVAQISDFTSSLSFSEGIATWSYTWRPPSCSGEDMAISVKYESFLSLAERQMAAVKLSISSSSAFDQVVIVDKLDQQSALRTTSVPQNKGDAPADGLETIWAVSPVGVETTTAYIVSVLGGDVLGCNASASCLGSSCSERPTLMASNITEGQGSGASSKEYRLRSSSRSATVYKYVGVASTDHFGDGADGIASAAARQAKSQGYEVARKAHSQAVSQLMASPLVADFRDPVTGALPQDGMVRALQITAISSAYYLYTNLLPFDPQVDSDPGSCRACNSLGVGGLASQAYGGKVFWDADMFMAPAAQGTHPRLARQFELYRINRAAQARQNTDRHGLKPGSALYPWTSGRYGQCYNTSAPCVMYQYHLNADIALSMITARNTSGDAAWFDKGGAADILDGIAMGLSGVLSPRNDTAARTWGIDVMTDADEYYMFVSDGSFTSAATSVVLENAANLRRQRGQALEDLWVEQTGNMAMPTSPDGSIVLEFRGMPNSIVSKQADVILAHFPFDYRLGGFDEAKRRAAMNYYAVRQDAAGPAMTWGMYAVAANTLAQSGCAFWTFLVKSFDPYLRMPWYQYSEQQDDHSKAVDPLTGNPMHPAFPFLTGHGGLLQTLAAGFLGLKVTDSSLVVMPSLPPQLEHFRPPVQFYNGAVVEFRMNRTHTLITRLDASLFDGLVPDQYGKMGPDMPITIGHNVQDPDGQTVHLAINQTVVVRNRVYDDNLDVAGNALQCRDATSREPTQPGQYPFAATDGYSGTAWQPATDDAPATLTVDTSSLPPTRLGAVHLDFGMRPPRSVKLLLSNSSSVSATEAAVHSVVTISQPWDPASPVVPYAGNTTIIALGDHIWSGAYAHLVVEGCWAGDGLGATVAEFALVASSV
ncbi:hypothetical protein RB594_004363 [Gaeumannomyces avenae]